MAHNCVDWTTQPPARKISLLVLTHGNDDVYTVIPKELETLEEIARREFNLGDVDVHFLSTCASLCHGKPARITKDVWEHISPYIGCATVNSRPRAVENQPQAGSSSSVQQRVDVASETTGDEQYFSAKRKLPSDADEIEPQDTTSDHGNDLRTSATEDEEEQAPLRPRVRRRLVSEEEDEEEHHEPERPPESPIASPTLPGKKEKIDDQHTQSAEPLHPPDIQVKQEKRTSSESGTQSTHDETDTQTQVDSGETRKLMIRVAHRPSNQEAKFMTKSTTSVGKVLAGACKSFGLDLSLATLYLIVTVEDEGGNVENLFPCDKNDTIARAGAECDSESRFILKIAGEA